MKLLLLLISTLLVVGCAETKIFDKNGHLVAAIQGDCINVTVRTPELEFHADVINHSDPTRAAYMGATGLVGGVGSAVTSALLVAP